MTVKQAAARLEVSPSLVYAWCRSGVLMYSRFGLPGRRGKIVIDEAALDDLAAACKRGKGQQPTPIVLQHLRVS
jgi:excisionase family DNA binding protein